jgi:SAM-dependent methyltransferase
MVGLVLVAGLAGLVAATSGLYVLLPPGLSGEAGRLADAMDIGPGSHVADVGAGGGSMARALAARVGPGGRVYATELPGPRLEALLRMGARAGAAPVEVVAGSADATNLPDGCCDAIVMRSVFHHLQDGERFAASLRPALRPGGRLAVIDFAPGDFWHLRSRPDGADSRRGGHGITIGDVTAAVGPAGFRLVQIVDPWSGPLFLAVYEVSR